MLVLVCTCLQHTAERERGAMARFAGLGLEPILADSDDDDVDMGFRRSGFGLRGGDDRADKAGENVAVSDREAKTYNAEPSRLLSQFLVPPA